MDIEGGRCSPVIDLSYLRQWIDRTSSSLDTICSRRVEDLAATLDRTVSPRAGDPLPPLWHWLFFHPSVRQANLEDDGHPARGAFLPPVPLPRRMWAGGRLEFLEPLQIDRKATRISTVKAVDFKQGRMGPLLFVTVGHEIQDEAGTVLLWEEQDLAYQESAADAGSEDRSGLSNARRTQDVLAQEPEWTQNIIPSTSLLFRYSALTFNAHRVHYDLPYAMKVEGYPGLVVHAPLVATCLLELLGSSLPEGRVRSFKYRAVSPLFDIEPFQICGRREPATGVVKLWAQTQAGRLAMSALATVSSSSEEL